MQRRSSRIPADLGANRIARARESLGTLPYDLTVSNPTACGLPYPDTLLDGLGHPRGLEHRPDPRGPAAARQAIAAWYRRWQAEIDPRQVLLTASTSEAYSFLFRLLADPGDTIMVPSPSYPLFEHLARLEGVRVATFELELDGGWRIDTSGLTTAPGRTRAVILVHPNNPTGSLVHRDDARIVQELCRERGWALIADEVFLPYPLEAAPAEVATFAGTEHCLTFTLGGLSKSVGLPQLKLAWINTSGPSREVASALEGLEYVADAYLSVSTPVALAAAEMLERGETVRAAIAARCRSNLSVLRKQVGQVPAIDVPPVGGGWSAVLRVPAVMEDEELCLMLLEDEGVAVHPGHLFGFRRPGFLVVSLLAPEPVFAEGVRRIVRRTG